MRRDGSGGLVNPNAIDVTEVEHIREQRTSSSALFETPPVDSFVSNNISMPYSLPSHQHEHAATFAESSVGNTAGEVKKEASQNEPGGTKDSSPMFLGYRNDDNGDGAKNRFQVGYFKDIQYILCTFLKHPNYPEAQTTCTVRI